MLDKNNNSGYLRQVKQQNMSQVLKHIWKLEPVSRIELVQETKLTSGTLTNLTQDLMKVGLLKETEFSTGNVGRRRIMLRLDTERFKIIGIDIGRTSFEVVVSDLAGKVLASEERETAVGQNPELTLTAVAEVIERLTARTIKNEQEILGVGVSIPGPMNLQDGVLLVPPNFPGWEHYPVQQQLESLLGRKIVMNDDARTSALAERWFGHGKQADNFVYITIGQGIGGGIVSDGEILLGSNGLYGQVGHITVIPNGELCECGNRGCWETVGSIPAIMRRWNPMYEIEGLTIDHFFAAVQAGEVEAKQCLEAILKITESTLTTLFNVYDPELIIVGGKLYAYLETYLPRIRAQVQANIYQFAQQRLRMESASFGSFQSAVGAAAMVFGELMERPLDVFDHIQSLDN